jgi:hypothetical protein
MNGALVVLAASMHAALILFLIVGGPLSVRLPGVARPHLVAALATGAVFLAGWDCPLTVMEDHFRAAAGWASHDSGFVERYLVEPVRPGGITPAIQAVIVVVWVVPSVAGHLLRRHPMGWWSARGR